MPVCFCSISKWLLRSFVRIAPQEILPFAKFLLLTGVLLPVFPNQEFGRFHINPFKTWVVVAAVSTISYGSYVLQKVTKQQGGVVLAALLGGAYSSTVTTIVMARRAAREQHPHLFAGGILIASSVMYLRLVALLALFNRQLMSVLALPFLVLAGAALGVGWLWTRRAEPVLKQYSGSSSPGIRSNCWRVRFSSLLYFQPAICGIIFHALMPVQMSFETRSRSGAIYTRLTRTLFESWAFRSGKVSSMLV